MQADRPLLMAESHCNDDYVEAPLTQQDHPFWSRQGFAERAGRFAKRIALTLTRVCDKRALLVDSEDVAEADAGNLAATPPLCSQVLPDFAVRMAAFYLESTAIVHLSRTDQACKAAFSMPGLVAELMSMRGFQETSKATTLGQLHLGENLLMEEHCCQFEFMSTDLDSRSREVLNRLADLFRRHKDATGRIETHAQPGAPASIARQICGARALAVQKALAHRGVEVSRLRLGGFGTSRPLLGASDEANRRAEIFVILGGMQFPPDHMPVRVDSSAKWAAWLRGEAVGTAVDESTVIVASDDSDDEGFHAPRFARLRIRTISTLPPSDPPSEDEDSSSSSEAPDAAEESEEELGAEELGAETNLFE